MNRQFSPMLMSSAFGILMVITAARPTGAFGLVALGVSAAALVAGVFFRPAATVAVLASIAAMALSDPAPLFAAVSGIAAAVYLVIRYAVPDGGPGRDADTTAVPTVMTVPLVMTMPTVIGLVGFTFAGLAASLIGVRLAWVPLVAPMIAVAILVVVALPLWADDRTGALPVTRDVEPPA